MASSSTVSTAVVSLDSHGRRWCQQMSTRKRLGIWCRKSGEKGPSLAEQLKPLSSTILPHESPGKNPKSIWVNPTKPRRSVVDPDRQRRSHHSPNPNTDQLLSVAAQLNACPPSDAALLAVLAELPQPISRGNVLLLLNNLGPWPKPLFFFNWLKSQDSAPMETIFYNVLMKSLRSGRQFALIEDLALEMLTNSINLDNITYSTIISCANKCGFLDKAVEWFERMYDTGLMPDEVTYSAILHVYAQLGKVQEVVSSYERGRACGWIPDVVAFSVMAKAFGDAGDYDGIIYVLQEMRDVGVKPNVVVYNTLLEAAGKSGHPGLAKSLFEEMLRAGMTPNEKTLTALVKIYGKVRWDRDAMELWEQMKVNKWPMDLFLYNTLLSMCADVGLEEEAEKLFQEMKESKSCRPDDYTYTAMLKLYGSRGNDGKAMELFENLGGEINVMGCTCLIQCLGKVGRIDDLVRVFHISVKRGVRPDDRLCGCLLSVMALCDKMEDVDAILSCLQLANPKLDSFIKLIQDDKIGFETIREKFKKIISDTAADARTPFCNYFIDICRNRNSLRRAHDLLYLGTVFGLYPSLHQKTANEWCMDLRSLSVGAAHTALEEWMVTLSTVVEREERLPKLLVANAGLGTHKFAEGLASKFASRVKQLGVPFRQSEDRSGCFVATRDDILSWVQSTTLSAVGS